jgi:hypothetical protein
MKDRRKGYGVDVGGKRDEPMSVWQEVFLPRKVWRCRFMCALDAMMIA